MGSGWQSLTPMEICGSGLQSLFCHKNMFNSYCNPMNNGDIVWELGFRVGESMVFLGNQGSGFRVRGKWEIFGNWHLGGEK